jgi:hypothetical protein
MSFDEYYSFRYEPGYLRWYSDGLQAGQPGLVSLHSSASRSALPSGVKGRGHEADYTPPLSVRLRMVELYIHSIICLEGIVLN